LGKREGFTKVEYKEGIIGWIKNEDLKVDLQGPLSSLSRCFMIPVAMLFGDTEARSCIINRLTLSDGWRLKQKGIMDLQTCIS
jgi:hypothetical protein